MKLIAERFLGGAVSFRSSQQEGTTFLLSLPLASDRAPEAVT
jgi:signal transduction histidine kinase